MSPGVLVGRGVDGLLVGWLAVAVWLGVWVAEHLGVADAVHDLRAVYWVAAVVTAAHFGLSYHLAYGEGVAAVRRRPLALLAGPLTLLAVLGGVIAVAVSSGGQLTRGATSALITSVYLLTTWHYVKQVYGVGRVGAAFAKLRLGPWDVRLLRYGLYPMWFLGATQVLVRGAGYDLAGYRVGFGLLPASAHHGLRILALLAAVPVAGCMLRLALRARRWPPSLLVAPYAAAVLWLAVPTDPLLTLLLLAPFHALQYLAIGHRAEVSLASTREGQHGVAWWLNIFGGAAAAGLLLSRWLPQALDAHLSAGAGTQLFAASFFVFLNLHHYLIDATIWRSSGGLVKAVVRGPTPAVAPVRAPVPVGAELATT